MKLAVTMLAFGLCAAAPPDLARLTAAQIDAVAKLRRVEEASAGAASKVEDLARRRQAVSAAIAARAAAFAPMLPVIERLELYPTETLLAVPMDPEQAIRGVLVMGGIARQLEREAAVLRADQTRLAGLERDLAAELPLLARARAAQAEQAAALDTQIVAAKAARRAAEDAAEAARRVAAERAAADATQAQSVRAALDRIAAARHAPEPLRARQAAIAFASGGALALPVAGAVQRGFGDDTEAGPSTGLSFRAAPSARVVSPCGGRVVFAAPFRSFGKLLIVDCGGSTHVVLAGLDRLDAEIGRRVQPGEPVGVMPDWNPTVAAGRPSLYVEVRRGGVAVDPAPYLKARS